MPAAAPVGVPEQDCADDMEHQRDVPPHPVSLFFLQVVAVMDYPSSADFMKFIRKKRERDIYVRGN